MSNRVTLHVGATSGGDPSPASRTTTGRLVSPVAQMVAISRSVTSGRTAPGRFVRIRIELPRRRVEDLVGTAFVQVVHRVTHPRSSTVDSLTHVGRRSRADLSECDERPRSVGLDLDRTNWWTLPHSGHCPLWSSRVRKPGHGRWPGRHASGQVLGHVTACVSALIAMPRMYRGFVSNGVKTAAGSQGPSIGVIHAELG